jgi:hypothetical protein
MSSFSRIILLIIVALSSLMESVSVHAIDTISDGWISPWGIKEIQTLELIPCRRVSNYTSYSRFVPTRSLAEWNSYKASIWGISNCPITVCTTPSGCSALIGSSYEIDGSAIWYPDRYNFNGDGVCAPTGALVTSPYAAAAMICTGQGYDAVSSWTPQTHAIYCGYYYWLHYAWVGNVWGWYQSPICSSYSNSTCTTVNISPTVTVIGSISCIDY